MKFIVLKKLFSVVSRSVKKFIHDQGTVIAGGLAFQTIFSIIPVFAIFIGVFSAFPSFNVYKKLFFDFLIKFIIPTSVNEAIVLINGFLENTKTVGTIGTIALICLSMGLFVSLDNQVNKIWTSTKKRNFINKILIYWAFLTVTPIAIAGYFYYSTIIHSILKPISQDSKLIEAVYGAITFLLLEIFIFFIYYIIPNTKVNPLLSFAVSFVVSVFWTFLKFVFTYYTRLFFTNWVIYGSIAAILFFMFWIYLNWIILLFGIEVLFVLQNKLYRGVFGKPQNFYFFDISVIIIILQELYADFKKEGKGIAVSRFSVAAFFDRRSLEEILMIMEKDGVLFSKNENENIYFIKKDLNAIKLSEIENIVMNRSFYKDFNNSLEFQEIHQKVVKTYCERKNDIIISKLTKKD